MELKEVFSRFVEIWRLPKKYALAEAGNQMNFGMLRGKLMEIDHALKHDLHIAGDVHFRQGYSVCVCIGKYGNRDYVRIFKVDHDSFVSLIEMLHRIEPQAEISLLDGGPHFDFRAYYRRNDLHGR